ncbi:MAG TPA: hypothetical protein VM784_00050 [Actinomycetota bacterium]|nr:hypothetical protein [Actinomycetota bacterium]
MNDLKDLFQREAANVDLAPDMPAATARRARRARVRTAAAGGATLVAIVAGGLGVALNANTKDGPPAGGDHPIHETVGTVAIGVERGVRWKLEWVKFSGDEAVACLRLVVDARNRGCALGGRAEEGDTVANFRWIPEMRRTIAWGTIPDGIQDVVIDLDPGGGYAGQLHDGGPARPDTFIQFIPGPNVAGSAVAYDAGRPIWSYTFKVEGHTTHVGSADPDTLGPPDFGPGQLQALDGGGEFLGWPIQLWLRTTVQEVCIATEARNGVYETCTRRAGLDGGIEAASTIRERNRVLIVGLVGADVAEVKIGYADGWEPQQLFDVRTEGLRAFSAATTINARDIVAYDVDGNVVERRAIRSGD